MTDAQGPGAGPAPAPRARWVRWLLVTSLAFNVLVLGAMASRALIHRHGPMAHVAGGGGGGGGGGVNLMAFAQQLPAERRREVWAIVTSEREALRPMRAAAREARAEIRAVLLLEPYDAKRFADGQTRLLEAEVRLRSTTQRVVGRIADVLTKEERALFARHVAAEGQKGHARGWRRGGGERDPLDEPAKQK